MARVGYGLTPGGSGEWTFVAGRAFLAAVPAGTHPGIVAKLTGLVSEPRITIEALVSLLPLAGEDAVANLVVVVPGDPTDSDGIPVSAVVRGRIAVDVFSVGGSRRFTDRDIRPWLLADFRSVIGLVIGSPLADVVPASRLDSGRTVELGAIAADTLFWSLAALAREDDDTIIRGPAPLPVHAPAPLPVPVPAPLSLADADTVVRPPQAAQDTVIARRRERRERRPAAEAAPLARGTHYGFRLPDGEERRLDAVYFLGRRPRSPRITGGPLPRLVTVTSPTSAVSATHLEIRQEGDTVVVTDLNSTNGTLVNPPRGKIGRSQRLAPGQSLAVAPGTTVDIGDGNIVEVLPASER
ncbi:FHA domain-containing protein [Cryobacterium psychrotolerans]|uniref:FHA domain-containing protein n=1 Tax=Cryobacterium psychrotolerans TaxID=386301 RepID=A0A1G8YVH9_9MICO|nr:FHA domain-containing protein [Cryobacterium psychrotolerans]TFD85664.1 FHA domain-containing protein [Cryobacterium psychrotolerans]SDK06444.1 FHA domain-containing protein [Cryobacterium psychrotolerans]